MRKVSTILMCSYWRRQSVEIQVKLRRLADEVV